MTPLEEDVTFVVESVGRRGASLRLELMFDCFAVVVPDAEALAATYDALDHVFDERVRSRFLALRARVADQMREGEKTHALGGGT